jgi:hypothetical protein
VLLMRSTGSTKSQLNQVGEIFLRGGCLTPETITRLLAANWDVSDAEIHPTPVGDLRVVATARRTKVC